MSKIIICSDLHLHNNRQFSNRTNWIDIGIGVLNQVISYSRNNDNIPIFILGDIFHLHDKVPTIVFNSFYDCIAEAKNIEFFLLLGTHNGKTTMENSLKQANRLSNIHVISNMFVDGLEDMNLSFIPYTKDEDQFKQDVGLTRNSIAEHRKIYPDGKCLLFLHQEIKGGVYDNDCTISNNIFKLLFKDFDHVFSGHIHKSQKLGNNITYVGSLHQLSFGECNNNNHFIIYNSDMNSYEEIPTTAPKFINIDNLDDLNQFCNGNFIKITCPIPITDKNKIRKKLYDKGCLGTVFEEQRNNYLAMDKIKLSPTTGYLGAFETYIDSLDIKQKKIIKLLGKNILQEVMK